MKRYNIDKIVKETKRIEKQESKIMRILNNLLPENTQELREVININNVTNSDIY